MIDVVSLAGSRDKPNDDVFGEAADRAWVIDGATGLGDPIVSPTSDAAWLARRASGLFARHAATNDTIAMMNAVASDLELAFARERKRAPVERWEIPCGAFMMISACGESQYELAWLGDCRAILRDAGGAVYGFGATPESEAREATGVTAGAGMTPEQRFRTPEALGKLRAGRARYNRAEGPWALAPDKGFVKGLKTARVTLTGPARALLMTDGFAALELRYDCVDAGSFVPLAAAEGLAALAQKLRKIEEEDDPNAVRFPRWKRSDDATAALLSMG